MPKIPTWSKIPPKAKPKNYAGNPFQFARDWLSGEFFNPLNPIPPYTPPNLDDIIPPAFDRGTGPDSAAARTFTYNGKDASIAFAYGKVKSGANLWYWDILPNGNFIGLYVHCYGPIAGIDSVYIEDKEVSTLRGLAIEHHLGTANQTVSTFMSNNVPGWVYEYPGVAYSVILFSAQALDDPAYDPLSVQFVYRAKKCRDPRLDPTLVNTYETENLGLIIADFFTEERFGGGFPDERINWDTVIATANYFDEYIDAPTNTVRRNRFGGIFRTQQLSEKTLNDLRIHGFVYTPYNNGKFQILVDRPTTSSGLVFSDQPPYDNILGGASFELLEDDALPNYITAAFTDQENNFKDAEAEDYHPEILNGRPISPEHLNLFGSPTFDQTMRTIRQKINRSAQGIVYRLPVSAEGIKVLPGDRIMVESCTELNVTNLDALVVDVEPNGLGFIFTLLQYSDSIYDNTQYARSLVPTSLFGPHENVPDPTNLISTKIFNAQEERIDLEITWTNPDYRYFKSVDIYIEKNSGNQEYLGTYENGRAYVRNIQLTDVIDVTAKTRNNYPQPDFSPGVTHNSLATSSIPPTVHGVSIEAPKVNEGTGKISWKPVVNRIDNLYNQTFWSAGSGLTGVDLTKVNDGNTAQIAFTLGTGDNWIIFDAGVGLTKEFIEILCYGTGGYADYSDDGLTWTVAGVSPQTDSGIAGAFFIVMFPDLGVHRYWRVRFTAPSGTDIFEVQLREEGSAYTFIKGYNVYEYDTNILHSFVPAPRTDLVVGEPLLFKRGTSNSGSQTTSFEVRAVSWSNIEGTPIGFHRISAWMAAVSNNLNLVNGDNNVVTLDPDVTIYKVTGPTAVFSIDGFKNGPNWQTIVLYNTTLYDMTIVHEDAGTTASERASTLSGSNAVIPAGWFVEIFYNEVTQRWIVLTASDSSGLTTAIVRVATSYSFSKLAWTTLLFDTEDDDDDDIYNLSNGEFTFKVERSYFLNVSAEFLLTISSGYVRIGYQVDTGAGYGTPIVLASQSNPGDPETLSASRLFKFNPGDKLKFVTYYDGNQNTGFVQSASAELFSLEGRDTEASDVGEVNTTSNVGTGEGLAKAKDALNFPFKSLKAGSGIGLTPSSNEVEIASTIVPGEINTTSNAGTGAGLAKAKAGVDLPFKSLKAGANITLTPSADEIEIAASGGGGGASGRRYELIENVALSSGYFLSTAVLTGYAGLMIECNGLIMIDETNGYPVMRISTAAGEMTSDYDWAIKVLIASSGFEGKYFGNNQSWIQLNNQGLMETDSRGGIDAEIFIRNHLSATRFKSVNFDMRYLHSQAPTTGMVRGVGTARTADPITAIRIFSNGGMTIISGEVRVYGLVLS